MARIEVTWMTCDEPGCEARRRAGDPASVTGWQTIASLDSAAGATMRDYCPEHAEAAMVAAFGPDPHAPRDLFPIGGPIATEPIPPLTGPRPEPRLGKYRFRRP